MIGKYAFKEVESQIRERWRKIDLLKKIQEKNAGGDPYFLLDGPPYANNVPHIGHIRNTVYKDFYLRHAFMQGKTVLFQPGFDTHGLPIENVVEKKLELKSKKDIKALGIQKFCDTCKDVATEYKDVWLRVYDKLGSWYSWKDPYITYKNDYIESVWWAFKKMWDKGMVYEGKKPVFWCPKCETALAGYEATDKYEDKEDPLIIVKFKVKNSENDHLLVFTTTPWTLPSNVAIVAKEDEYYVKAKTKEGNLIIAKNLISLLEELEIKYEIIEEFKGKKLDGLEYEPVVDTPTQEELTHNPRAQRVYMSIQILKERVNAKVAQKKGIESGDIFEHFVSVDDGTGLVHCAPGHGKTDNLIGKHYGLPEVSPLDDQCKFTDEAGKYAGRYVKDADPDIMEDMKKKGTLLYDAKLKHSYPLCWRCSSPLIFRMSNQWFLKTDMIKEKMLDANENVRWQPEFAGERFHSWVANAEDWNFSRQRFWGIPIPIWKSEDGELKVIGSKEELEKELGKKLGDNFDLHTVSEVKIKSKDGKEMQTIGDIFDVWFDSGSAPYAAFHYPFENKEIFEKHYPVDRINESQDQVRGWFYSLMFCGVSVFDKAPYKTISMPAWVVDKNGEKLSKSKGNFIAAEDGLDELGADNVRFYYCWDIDPASGAKFNTETVKTEASRTHSILWNLHKLLVTNVLTEKENDADFKLPVNVEKLDLKTEDKWILSRLIKTITESLKNYDEFKLHLAGRAINEFVVNDLSRTYIQFVRDRLEEDTTPLSILLYSIKKIVRLLAPVSPHVTDAIYQNLNEHIGNYVDENFEESVHLELLPGLQEDEKKTLTKYRDEDLEKDFEILLETITGILAARDSANIGIRWPVNAVTIDAKDKDIEKAIKKYESMITSFVNAKKIILKKPDVKYDVKLNFREVGQDFGQETGDVATFIKKNEKEVFKQVEEGKDIIKAGNFELKQKHFNVEVLPPEGYVKGDFRYGNVYLSKEIPKDLMPEGYAREVLRRIQVLRKNMSLVKSDRINLEIVAEKDLLEMINSYKDLIKKKAGISDLKLSEKKQTNYDESHKDNIKGKELKFYCGKKQ